LNGDIPVIKWNFKNYVVNTFWYNPCNLPVGIVVDRSRR
jgi:hypothetical protein